MCRTFFIKKKRAEFARIRSRMENGGKKKRRLQRQQKTENLRSFSTFDASKKKEGKEKIRILEKTVFFALKETNVERNPF